MRTRDKVNSLRLADTLIRSIKGYALTLATKPTLSPAESRRLEQLRKLWPTLKTVSTLMLLVCLTGCAAFDRNGFSLHSEVGITATEQRSVQMVSRRASQSRSMACEILGYGCGATSAEVVNDK